MTVYSKSFEQLCNVIKIVNLARLISLIYIDSGRGTDMDGEFCSSSNPCSYKQGHCDNDDECVQDLVCGDNTCTVFWSDDAEPTTDCCVPGLGSNHC